MELGRRSVLLDINYTGEGGYERVARERFEKFLESQNMSLVPLK